MRNDEMINDRIERELQELAPASAPGDLVQRLEESLERAISAKELGNRRDVRSPWQVKSGFRRMMWLVTQFRAVPMAGALTAMILFGVWYFDGPPPSDGERESVGGTIPESGKRGMGLVMEDAFRPFEVENHLVAAADDGIIGTIGDVPFRRVRYQLIDSYTWKNDSDGASIRMAVPREEILIIPVSTY